MFLGIEKRTSSLRNAAIITAISRYSIVILNLAVTMFLSRLLAPAEFGNVSIITVFTSFFTMISDFGIGKGVIQDKELTTQDLNGIYSFNVYVSVIIAICFIPLSVILSFVYNNIKLYRYGLILSISLFFSSLQSVPNAICLKDHRFLMVGFTSLLSSMIGGLTAIALAINGLGGYSLVLQSLIVSMINAVILEIIVRRSSKLSFQIHPYMQGVYRILPYSLGQFGFNVVNYFARNLDNLLIGKFIGLSELGYYDKAYKLTCFPVTYLTGVISNALHPILSDYKEKIHYIYTRYIRILKFISLIGAFITPLCVLSSKEIIILAFGSKWSHSIIPFAILSSSIWFQMTSTSCGAIYQSVGKTDIMLKSCLIFVPIQIACIVAGVISGSLIICSSLVSLSFILKFFIDYLFLIKYSLTEDYVQFISNFLSDFVIVVVESVILVLVQRYILIFKIDNVPSIIIKSLVAFVVFGIMVKLLHQEHYLLRFVPIAKHEDN